MKVSIGLSLTFALFFCLVKCEETKSLNSDPTSASKEDDRQGLIEDAVRSLLGVKELSEMGSNFRRRSPPTPPRYMLDLYDRYRTGQTQSKGNTVRSILPMRGSLEGVEMLVFNLTGIHSEEQILQSRLHIYKRRRPRGGGGGGGRKREVNRLKVTDLSMVSPPRWLDVPRQKNGGWQSFDMTEAVIQCRGAQHNGHYLLGVSAESRRPNGRYRAVPMRRVARMNSQPFLIVFSEDRNNKTNVSSEQQRDSTNYHELRDIWLRSRNGSEQMIPQNTSSLPRIKRAILSNELPYYSLRINSLSGKSYGVLSKTQYRKTYSRILPLPKDPKQSTKLPKLLQKPKKSKRKNRKLPFWWARQDGRRLEATAKGLLCQRRSLIVDFSQIGWGDWIISPKSFDSHYCAGSCNFPLTQNMKPSNHATIQSLVHALKMDPEVPSPCCVPYSTSSLTLLYIDENKNVVLKNYPNMIVESCACR